MTFFEAVKGIQEQQSTFLCLGLDLRMQTVARHDKRINEQHMQNNSGNQNSIPSEILADAYLSCAQRYIDICHRFVCAVKINLAFYQQYGLEDVVASMVRAAQSHGLPVILDAKYADIGATAQAYAQAAYARFRADAVTLNPYLGNSSTMPFIQDQKKGAFVLAHTSNHDAATIQTFSNAEQIPLFVHVVNQYKNHPQIGFVVGATQLEAIHTIRENCDQWILAPGIGAQGASLADVLSTTQQNIILPISRAITEADSPMENIAHLHTEIKRLRNSRPSLRPSLHLSQKQHNDHKDAVHHSDPLKEIIASFSKHDIIQFGSFKYKSGIEAPFYMNIRNVIGDPNLLRHMCNLMQNLCHNLAYDRLCGIAYGALGPAFTLAQLLSKPVIVLRKEGAKQYGSKDSIIGPYIPGERVVIVEEMTTTGSSIEEVALQLRENGLIVNDAIVFYTGIGTPERNLSKIGITLHRVLNFDRLIDLLEQLSLIDPNQKQLLLNAQES